MAQFNLLIISALLSLFASQNPVSAAAINSTDGLHAVPHGSGIYYEDSSDSSSVLERRDFVENIEWNRNNLEIWRDCDKENMIITPSYSSSGPNPLVSFKFTPTDFKLEGKPLNGKDKRKKCLFTLPMTFPAGKKYTVYSVAVLNIKFEVWEYVRARVKMGVDMDDVEFARLEVTHLLNSVYDEHVTEGVKYLNTVVANCETEAKTAKFTFDIVDMLEFTRKDLPPFGKSQIGHGRDMDVVIRFKVEDCP